jgi:hypothetical protein
LHRLLWGGGQRVACLLKGSHDLIAESIAHLPVIERKERLERLFKKVIHGLRYSEHVITDGSALSRAGFIAD